MFVLRFDFCCSFYLLDRHQTFSAGLKVGAVLGLLYALNWYFFMFIGTFDLMYFLKEMVTNIVMSALTAGVVAYVGGKVT